MEIFTAIASALPDPTPLSRLGFTALGFTALMTGAWLFGQAIAEIGDSYRRRAFTLGDVALHGGVFAPAIAFWWAVVVISIAGVA